MLLYHKSTEATLVESGHMHTTEYALSKTILQTKPLYIMGIYHPPQGNDTTNAIFIDDITDLLADRIGKHNNTAILGDINMHIDGLTNADSHIFSDTIQAFGLKHYVTSPTHKYSHILDLVYSKVNLSSTSITAQCMNSCLTMPWWLLTPHSTRYHGNPLKGSSGTLLS